MSNGPIGFINPAVYAIGTSGAYSQNFHDITSGDNTWSDSPSAFYAVSGYDLCTGWGVPAGKSLLDTLAGLSDSLGILADSDASASGVFGGPFLPASPVITLTNSEDFPLTWALMKTNPATWLNASPKGGVLAAHDTTNVMVHLTQAVKALAVGNYTTSLKFTNVTSRSARAASFQLHVLRALSVSPTNAVVINGAVGGPFFPGALDFNIANIGATSAVWKVTKSAGWLAVNQTTGNVAGASATAFTVNVTTNANKFQAGTYTATVSVLNQKNQIVRSLPFTLRIGQSLVNNGDFETGNFSGWEVDAASTHVTTSKTFVHGGTHGAQLGQTNSPGWLSQMLPTVAGQNYRLSLWFKNPQKTGGMTNEFIVRWEGSNIFDRVDMPLTGWSNLQFTVTATQSNSVLQIGGRDDPSYLALDDVSLKPIAMPAALVVARDQSVTSTKVIATPTPKKLAGQLVPGIEKLTAKGLVPTTNVLHLAIGLPLRDEAGLDQFLRQVYDPASTNYHHYLTPVEFTEQFGPTEDQYAVVKNFALTNGFEITGIHPNRVVLDVIARVADAERAFGVSLKTYRHPKEARDFYAPDAEPTVAPAIPILQVNGLDNYWTRRPNHVLKPALAAATSASPHNGSSPSGTYIGNDFRNAYVPGTSLTGAGQSIGLLQFDGYSASDITAYINNAGINTSVTLTNIPVAGGVSSPGSGNVEVCLDIEMSIAMAPGLDKIYVYEGANGSTAWPTILSQMADDNLAKQLSCSWGGGSPDATSEQIFKQMAAQGQSFFNASGDNDAFISAIPFPSDSTNITQVGGTVLTMNDSGASYASETVWNDRTPNSNGGDWGSSGGVSTYYTIPWWQTNINYSSSQGSSTMRNVPDVAMTASGIYLTYGNGSVGTVGGTSAAAPLWAGFMALVNQQATQAAKPSARFINPAIYAIAAGTNYNSAFRDTVTGDNTWPSSSTKYYAVTGYDLCTGLGAPNGTNLINALMPLTYYTAITNASWTLLAESAVPTNGVIDPGETVSVSFNLMNVGNLTTSNLVATLLPNAGVLAPSGPQAYGTLSGYGGSTNRVFIFTTAGTCGSNIIAAIQLQDGSNNLGTVNFILPLGKVSGLTQNFDNTSIATLPAGWMSVNITTGFTNLCWMTTAANNSSAPNSVFCQEPASRGQNALVSPVFPVTSTSAQLSFRHNYSFETTISGSFRKKTTNYLDGGVLEIQIGNGNFTDILTAGGSFVAGAYNHTVASGSGFDNPLGGRSAWDGSSGGWITTTVSLPVSAAGKNVRLRWNCATDTGNGGASALGWYVDSITVSDAAPSCLSVFTDVAVSQSLDPSSINVGQNLVYTITVTNLGPQSAANLVVTDTIPVNATFVSTPGGNFSGGNVVFSVGTLPVNAVTNFTLTLAPAVGSVFTNLAVAATVTPEVTTVNNSVTLIVTQGVSSYPPSLTVPPVAQSIECGGNVTFSVTVAGTPPMNLQWSLDGVAITTATNTSLSLTNVHLPSHVIAVVVANLFGSVTSSVPFNVSDTLAPVVTLNGGNPLYLELGSVFMDPGATANDICAGIVPAVPSGVVNAGVVGTNMVTYTAADGNGNTGSATRTVIVRDTTPPVIAWSFTNLVLAADANCSALMTNVTGTNFILATDLSGALAITQSPTNNAVLLIGTNLVVLTVADASGNKSFSTNVIVVKDQTPPVVTLIGSSPMTNELGVAFVDPGAIANDNCSGLAQFTTNGSVNVSAVGTNILTYIAVDVASNTNTAMRIVVVQDTTPPVILWSFTNLVLATGTNVSVAMPDVTGINYILATDLSGALTITQSPTNNAALPLGTNVVLLTVADASGNSAFSTNTIVVVVSTNAAPQISNLAVQASGGLQLQLSGSYGATYVLEGATDLFSGVWLPIATNTLGPDGVWQFTDFNLTNTPVRFYRLKLVQ